MYPSAKGKSAYRKYTGKEPHTIKKLVVNSFRKISDQPQPVIQLSDTDFKSGQDSTIMVGEQTRGTKLEGSYKRRKAVLLEQSNHTITFLTRRRRDC